MDAFKHAQLKFGTVHGLNDARRHLSEVTPVSCEKTIEEYICRKCNFKTNCTIRFKRHSDANFTTSYSEYKCENCLFETNSSLIYLDHSRSILCSKRYYVHKPDNTYTNRSLGTHSSHRSHHTGSLKKHAVDKDINWVRCDHCFYKCKLKSDLKRHILQKHTSDKDIRWLECDQCPYKCKVKYSLTKHILQKHTSDNDISWFKCDQCHYKCKVKGSLKKHILQKHIAEKDINWFQCHECSYKCKVKGSLKKHVLQKHIADKDINWFECEQCSYKCKVKDSLKRHKFQKHTPKNISWVSYDDGMYNCKRKSDLRPHISQKCAKIPFHCENAIEDYFCGKCDVKTSCKISFKTHNDVTFTNSVSEYRCEYCLFLSNSLLIFLNHSRSSLCLKFK